MTLPFTLHLVPTIKLLRHCAHVHMTYTKEYLPLFRTLLYAGFYYHYIDNGNLCDDVNLIV